MVRHNNEIPNRHFHKDWQKYVKMWFNQPMQKRRRARLRRIKLSKTLPRPVERLRPVIHKPTVRYNTSVRPGRGFTVKELKAAGLNENFARTIGITVDLRRRNKSLEGLRANVQRLKEYRTNLILYPLSNKKQKEQDKPVKTVTKGINKVKVVREKLHARPVTKEEQNFQVNSFIRKARADAKYAGIRKKRKENKSENIEPPMKKVRV